jgi:hypothetical protein
MLNLVMSEALKAHDEEITKGYIHYFKGAQISRIKRIEGSMHIESKSILLERFIIWTCFDARTLQISILIYYILLAQ